MTDQGNDTSKNGAVPPEQPQSESSDEGTLVFVFLVETKSGARHAVYDVEAFDEVIDRWDDLKRTKHKLMRFPKPRGVLGQPGIHPLLLNKVIEVEAIESISLVPDVGDLDLLLAGEPSLDADDDEDDDFGGDDDEAGEPKPQNLRNRIADQLKKPK